MFFDDRAENTLTRREHDTRNGSACPPPRAISSVRLQPQSGGLKKPGATPLGAFFCHRLQGLRPWLWQVGPSAHGKQHNRQSRHFQDQKNFL